MGAPGEPLKPADARALIRRILASGGVTWDTSAQSHFLDELANDNLMTLDCTNVLRGGVPDPAEWNDEYEEYRYRVHTNKICVVITFVSEHELFIVTAWRKKP
jgi:hypothetical protein